MKRRSLLALISLLPWPVFASELETVFKGLVRTQAMTANFEQTKTMAGVDRPLKSSGKLFLVPSQGLVWQQVKPFKQTMVIGNKEIKIITSRAEQVIKSEENPFAASLMRFFLNLVEGNAAGLRQAFVIEPVTDKKAQWTFKLLPKPGVAGFDKIFKEVRIAGATWIDFVSITDKGGDRTEIRFSDQREEKIPESILEQIR